MSDQAALQGGTPVASTSGMIPMDDRPRVSANSFKALTDRLKKTSTVPQAQVQHIPEVKPATVEVATIRAPQVVVTAPVELAAPKVEVAPPPIVTPVVRTVEPEKAMRAVPAQSSAFALPSAPPAAAAIPENDVDDFAALAPVAAVIEKPAPQVTIAESVLPAPVIEVAPVPVVVEPVVEAPVEIDLAALRKREAAIAEFDHLMRMIYAVPSHEDRADYLKEAAIEQARLEREKAAAVVELEIEDEPFLSDDLVATVAAPTSSPEPIGVKAVVDDFDSFDDFAPSVAQPAPVVKPAVETSAPFLSDDMLMDFEPEPVAPVVVPAPEIVATEIAAVEDFASETSLEDDFADFDKVVHQAPIHTAPPPPENLTATDHLASLDTNEAGELARSLLDMMAATSSTGLPQERALASDTLLRMMPKLPLKALIMLSERLAIMDAPPHLLVSQIISDPRIDVAGPMLENGQSIPDQDLALVIAEEDPKKLRLIGRRRKISRHISASLVACKDPSTHLTLVRNAAAEISHETFLTLTNTARTEPELLAPLATRKDLPAPLAFELFWYAPAQLRRYILSRFLTDSETLTKILKITLATQGLDEGHEATAVPAEAIQNALQLAVVGQVSEAAESLRGFARLSPATIERIITDQQGEPMAVLMKALGYPRNEVKALLQVLQLAETGLIDSSRDVEELISIYETLSYNKARILLTYWDWATQRSGPYALMH